MSVPARRRQVFKFRLYIADQTQNSVQAVANITAFGQTHLAGQHQIEIVDVLKEPKRALADGVFMTPTLIKLAPAPFRRIVGTLSQEDTVLQALGLDALTP